MQLGVVGQVQHVVALVGRGQVDDHQQGGRRLGRGHPCPLHFLRQARNHLGHTVLHQHLGLIGVGAQSEGDGQAHGPVGGGLGRLVEHALHPVDRLLDGRSHRLGNHGRIGARIDGAHHHGGRHDLRIFRDRQIGQGDEARDEDDQGQHRGKAGPADEEPGEIHGFCPFECGATAA